MGYCTQYQLIATPDSHDIWEAVKANNIIYFAVGDDGDFGDSCKWYDHEKDMVEFSKKFPLVIFHLHGEGEKAGDLWDAYFRNGKKQICKAKIIIPPMREDAWI